MVPHQAAHRSWGYGQGQPSLFPKAEYETSRRKLSPRDVVLLFTDGLFEVEGSGGQLYDYRKLVRAVGDRTVLPAAELCQSLITEVQRFSATQSFNGDVCLVAMDVQSIGCRGRHT
jgi:serine phosphatase RsbU (regulator of sigma subunit)